MASAFDWPGWDRWTKTEEQARAVLAASRPPYAPVAERAGLAEAFAATGDLEIVERLPGPYHMLDHAWEMEDRDLIVGHAKRPDRPAWTMPPADRASRISG